MYPLYEYDKRLVSCVPSPRQLAHARREFYGFICWGVNTFTDREWGTGREDPAIFAPTEYDPAQWIDAMASAGMTGVILICKHHDGFCLWPSRYTEHSVKNSPLRNGHADVVRDVSEECGKRGLGFGVYLSPWDMHEASYGQGKAYDDFFCAQLTELLTGYGPLFSVWFDGACGEGPNGKRQVYDWDRYYALIREYQPDACISICGPDVRWCGNEAGYTRDSEWSVLPTAFDSPDEVAEKSQKEDGAAFREKKIDMMERDLGSREFLKGAKGLRWYPSETDTSIRPGWFYHAAEDGRVRDAETLFELWTRTVGGNSSLLLNIPPDRRGLFHENDVKSLGDLGAMIRSAFAVNLAENAAFTADCDDGIHTAEALRTDSWDAYFKTPDGENTAEITVTLPESAEVSYIVLKEHIPMSQRVERFAADVRMHGGKWREAASGTTVGYKRIVRIDPIKTDAVRVRILDSRVCPVLSFIGVY
ncbi:MAG: alpha-fucosidase [Ruminococcaceae bacterium]|nr:alpha-fucosidase [Oscillospiraceae bacterium]